jgi:hypothetical protein
MLSGGETLSETVRSGATSFPWSNKGQWKEIKKIEVEHEPIPIVTFGPSQLTLTYMKPLISS